MNVPKFPKFTFEDWLEDRLTGKEYTYMGENDLSMILHFARQDPDTLTQEDYEKIRKYQGETYDMALEMDLETTKHVLSVCIESTANKQEYLKLEIAETEKKLSGDNRQYQRVLQGKKDTARIRGGTYKQVIDCNNKFKSGGLSTKMITESELFAYSLNAKYLEWLKQEMESIQAPLVTIDPNHIKNILNSLSPFISGQENNLTNVLNHRGTGQKIHFQGTQSKLARSFRQFFEVNHWIDGTKLNITKWLCDNFNYLDKNRQSKPLSYQTIWSYLTKEQYK